MPWHPNTTDCQLIESGTQRAFGLPSPNIHSGRAKDCRCIFRAPASVIFLEWQLFLEMQQYKWVLKVECLIDLINQWIYKYILQRDQFDARMNYRVNNDLWNFLYPRILLNEDLFKLFPLSSDKICKTM